MKCSMYFSLTFDGNACILIKGLINWSILNVLICILKYKFATLHQIPRGVDTASPEISIFFSTRNIELFLDTKGTLEGFRKVEYVTIVTIQ